MIAMKAYFKGSGKSAHARCRLLTLAAYAGPPNTWLAVEPEWVRILDKHHERYFDAKRKRCRDKPFLVGELLDILEKARAFGMIAIDVTVDLDAHRELSGSHALPTPGRICAEYWIHELLAEAGSLSCFFDKAEEFSEELTRYWRSEIGRAHV